MKHLVKNDYEINTQFIYSEDGPEGLTGPEAGGEKATETSQETAKKGISRLSNSLAQVANLGVKGANDAVAEKLQKDGVCTNCDAQAAAALNNASQAEA